MGDDTDVLIAEDLLLLLLDDESGRITHSTHLDVGVGGGLLVELALRGAVEIGEAPSRWAKARVRPAGTAPPADPLLVECLALVGEKERTAQDLVGRLGRKRNAVLLDRLVQRGVLERRSGTLLGIFPRDTWPALDHARERDVRRRLGDVLVRGATPDERTAALVALLSALDLAHKVLDREGLARGEVKRRAKEVAQGDWAAKAVRDAVAAAQAAVAAAATVAATSAVASGS